LKRSAEYIDVIECRLTFLSFAPCGRGVIADNEYRRSSNRSSGCNLALLAFSSSWGCTSKYAKCLGFIHAFASCWVGVVEWLVPSIVLAPWQALLIAGGGQV